MFLPSSHHCGTTVFLRIESQYRKTNFTTSETQETVPVSNLYVFSYSLSPHGYENSQLILVTRMFRIHTQICRLLWRHYRQECEVDSKKFHFQQYFPSTSTSNFWLLAIQLPTSKFWSSESRIEVLSTSKFQLPNNVTFLFDASSSSALVIQHFTMSVLTELRNSDCQNHMIAW